MYCRSKKIVNTWCQLPFERVKITSSGEVNFCCHMGLNYLGNILEKPFEDIWFGNEAENIRDELRRGSKFHHMCDTNECISKYVPIEFRMRKYQVLATGYPFHIELDLHGSHCNFGGKKPTPETACIMCPRSRPDFCKHLEVSPDRTMEIVQRIKHIMPYIREINVLGIAEPFWQGKIFDVLEGFGIKRYKNISVFATSNASVFDAEARAKFAEITNASKLDFSIDAATPETFLKIRRQKSFNKVCENVKAWCKERPSDKHYVSIHNNINMINIHEVPDMVRLSKKLGVDLLKLIPTHECSVPTQTLIDIMVNTENAQAFHDAEAEAIRVSEEIGQPLTVTRPLSLGYKVIKAN